MKWARSGKSLSFFVECLDFSIGCISIRGTSLIQMTVYIISVRRDCTIIRNKLAVVCWCWMLLLCVCVCGEEFQPKMFREFRWKCSKHNCCKILQRFYEANAQTQLTQVTMERWNIYKCLACFSVYVKTIQNALLGLLIPASPLLNKVNSLKCQSTSNDWVHPTARR